MDLLGGFLKHFDVEGGGPSPKDMGIREPAGGGSNSGAEVNQAQSFKDILNQAQEKGAEKTKASHEKWAERRKNAKDKIKGAWGKTKEVTRATTDTVKGLASKDVRGELKQFATDKIADAKDNVVDKYDTILDKTDQKKDALVAQTREKTGQLADAAKDKLVTQPAEKVKGFGKDVAHYFSDKGKNIADSIKARMADTDAKYFQKKADKARGKWNKLDDKAGEVKHAIDEAQGAGRQGKADRLQRRYDRLASKKGDGLSKESGYRESARNARESASKLRTEYGQHKITNYDARTEYGQHKITNYDARANYVQQK